MASEAKQNEKNIEDNDSLFIKIINTTKIVYLALYSRKVIVLRFFGRYHMLYRNIYGSYPRIRVN